LVQPLIKHSLDYLIEERIKNPKQYLTPDQLKSLPFGEVGGASALLNLKVCDISSGSGHILLSAARRIALAVAQAQTGEDQPNPQAMRRAMKEVIRNCIYGVDKNPLAVELCKIALWLKAYNPGEPLNFLDHHIKCGDSIVGLAHRDELENGIADEAFKTLPGDEKEVAAKARAYKKFMDGKGYNFLKVMADTQVAQFFIPKTSENKHRLISDSDYQAILKGFAGWQNQQTAYAVVVAQEKRFFHWFLEFPEVFQNGGFDCVLGNPPYLGGKRISGNYGDNYLNTIKALFQPSDGGLDLVIYFVRRIYSIQKIKSFQSIITTNTISQGDSRRGELEYLLNNEAELIYVADTIPWPGKANVKVTPFSLYKAKWFKNRILNNKSVIFISELFEEIIEENPVVLKENLEIAYCGSVLSGEGFILSKDEANKYLKDIENERIIKPYMNGDDLNNTINQIPKRLVIDFKDWDKEIASHFQECFELIKQKVKPEREKVKRKTYRDNWWQFAEKAVNLYKKISDKDFVLATARTSKTLAFVKISSKCVFSANLTVFTIDNLFYFKILQSNILSGWAWKYGTTLKSDLIYAPSDIVNIYPFPQHITPEIEHNLERTGESYHEHRRLLMLKMQLGLTKTYNAFHAKEITKSIANPSVSADLTALNMNKKAIEKQYGKEVWNLWNHLNKTPGTCTFEEAEAGIIHLRELHVQMDNAVLEAYGWQAPSPSGMAGVGLLLDFYEVDYLPENDRIRFTIHPDARKEILKRLLELNHKIHDEEVRAGLWDKKKTGAKYTAKKGNNNVAEEPGEGYGQGKLFETPNLFSQSSMLETIMTTPKPKPLEPVLHPLFNKIEWRNSLKNFKVIIRNSLGREFRYHVLPEAQMGKFTGNHKQIKPNSPMADNIIDKNEGDTFEFGGQKYKIEKIEV